MKELNHRNFIALACGKRNSAWRHAFFFSSSRGRKITGGKIEMNYIRKQLEDIPVNFDKKIIDRFDSRAPIFYLAF